VPEMLKHWSNKATTCKIDHEMRSREKWTERLARFTYIFISICLSTQSSSSHNTTKHICSVLVYEAVIISLPCTSWHHKHNTEWCRHHRILLLIVQGI